MPAARHRVPIHEVNVELESFRDSDLFFVVRKRPASLGEEFLNGFTLAWAQGLMTTSAFPAFA